MLEFSGSRSRAHFVAMHGDGGLKLRGARLHGGEVCSTAHFFAGTAGPRLQAMCPNCDLGVCFVQDHGQARRAGEGDFFHEAAWPLQEHQIECMDVGHSVPSSKFLPTADARRFLGRCRCHKALTLRLLPAIVSCLPSRAV